MYDVARFLCAALLDLGLGQSYSSLAAAKYNAEADLHSSFHCAIVSGLYIDCAIHIFFIKVAICDLF